MKQSFLPVFNKLAQNIGKHDSWIGLDQVGRNSFIELYIRKEEEKPILILCANDKRAKELSTIIEQFSTVPVIPIFEKSYLPIEILAKEEEKSYEKSLALYYLIKEKKPILVVSIGALIEFVPSKFYYEKSFVKLKQGDMLEPSKFKEVLFNLGYQIASVCEDKGQFAARGGLIDFYSPNYDFPIRIEWFDDEIDSIRFFSEETQKTISNTTEIEIIPAQDFFYNESIREEIISSIHFELDDTHLDIEALKDTNTINDNILQYYSYKSKKFQGNLLDYCEKNCQIVVDEVDRVEQQLLFRYEMVFSQLEKLLENNDILPSKMKSIQADGYFKKVFHELSTICLSQLKVSSSFFPVDAEKNYYIHNNFIKIYPIKQFISEMNEYLAQGYKIIFYSSTQEVIETLENFLKEYHFTFQTEDSFNILSEFNQKIVLIKEQLYFDSILETDQVIFMNANIFNITTGDSVHSDVHHHKEKKKILVDELSIGDYIVHENHGIGIYLGIDHKKLGETEKDYIVIQYKGADKLFVPLDQLHLVDKYVGREDKKPKIHKLGSIEWTKSKSRIKKSIEDMADQLLELHAKREMKPGFAFAPDDSLQYEFERAFPYNETPDQLKAIKEVKADMEKPIAMDRLICGDVGYGKTEVAIRAAFKSVCNGKQVAVLVPTTILAMQHYETFKNRMEEFGINLGLLTRFCTVKEQNTLFKKIRDHEIDVVIGTHKLFNKKLHFSDLGLLIIDEEQRFGVKHKEQIKALQENIDVLTMSATPIPRTLYFSLTGIKDMSIIETPPNNRLPIQTYVMEEYPIIIEQAVHRELLRGGQVFVVYNNIQHLEELANQYRQLFPDCRIITGHGRMKEAELEDVILKFQNKEADILVCTTIIETGIDMPNVNTMLVHHADHMGLAQLYQLKGRVGRSQRVAYAYLMYQKDKLLTDEAKKRLTTLKECTALGSGYKISKRDLEIRGSGNLLGSEQSGHVAEIGFELYLKMLMATIQNLKKKSHSADVDDSLSISTIIDVNISAFIPEEYISDTKLRISIYQRIDKIENSTQLKDMEDELIDRFGTLPQTLTNLFKLVQLKHIASRAHILSIKQRNTSLYIKLNPQIDLDLQKLIMYIHKSKEKMLLKNINEETFIVIETKLKNLTLEYIDSLKLVLTQLKYVVTSHNN